MRKKYPSQIKYEANNPTITFRMKIEEKAEIEQMAEDSGKSISDLVRMALLGLKEDLKDAFKIKRLEGYEHGERNGKRMGKEEGLKEGEEKYAIWVYCKWCKGPILIVPNSDNHNKILQVVAFFHHPECPK